jgi:hypothetical protein
MLAYRRMQHRKSSANARVTWGASRQHGLPHFAEPRELAAVCGGHDAWRCNGGEIANRQASVAWGDWRVMH